jgi:hypothetical protein
MKKLFYKLLKRQLRLLKYTVFRRRTAQAMPVPDFNNVYDAGIL